MASSSAMKANGALLLVASLVPVVLILALQLVSADVGLWDLVLLELIVLAYFKDNVALMVKGVSAAVPEEPEQSALLEDATAGGDEDAADAGTPPPAAVAATPSGKLPTDARYTETVKSMVEQFLAAERNENPVTNWQQVLDTPTLSAFSDPTSQNRYKIITQLSNSPLTCFDLLSDVGRRKEWDDMCDEARILEQIDPDTRIVYVRTKPVMFVAARDIVLLSHRTKLADGRFMLVTRSVDFPGAPVHPKCVRMESGLAGLICGPGAKGGCEVFQIMDGDLKGNIPSAVRNFVLNKMLPNSTAVLNKKVSALPPLDRPVVRRRAGGARGGASDMTEQIARLSEALVRLEARVAARKGAGGVITRVRNGLEWATPFMLGVVYLILLYRFFTRRRR